MNLILTRLNCQRSKFEKKGGGVFTPLIPFYIYPRQLHTHRVNSQYIYFVSNPVKNMALLSKCAVSVNRARVRLTK